MLEQSDATAATQHHHQHRVRRRPVSFGNPALGTYEGDVYTLEFPNQEHQHQLIFPLPVVEQALSVDRTVAMVDVPTDQVPEGVFSLIRPHFPKIRHLRIVIAEPVKENEGEKGGENKNDGEEQPPPKVNEEISRSETAGGGNSDAATTTSPTRQVKTTTSNPQRLPKKKPRKYLILFELVSEEDAEEMVEFLHGQPYTSFDDTIVCSMYHVVALQGKGGVNLQSPFFGSNNKNTQQQQQQQRGVAATEGDYNCPVCLEHFNLAVNTTNNTRSDGHDATTDQQQQQQESVLTTVCNHSFHMDCLLKWQDSPCPVCRYDHSGLNEALSQCHICGTTDHIYTCLICGTISCGRPASGPSPPQQSSNPYATDCAADNASTLDRLAPAPHMPPIGIPSLSHARQHYDETLHAYALDTETQHVWDFAGQGYVHRLLQNKEDGKLVEVSDPMAHSEERTQNPGLSDTQETQVVHQKLEGMASSYYTLLKSQLEQQRIHYEDRLEEIRRDIQLQRRASDLITALKQERHQLSQRLVLLQGRCDKVKGDVTFLSSMVESLESNKASFRENVIKAQQERAAVRKMFEELLPPLQEKVTRLMLQLEADLSNTPPVITSDAATCDGSCNSGDKKKAGASSLSRKSKK